MSCRNFAASCICISFSLSAGTAAVAFGGAAASAIASSAPGEGEGSASGASAVHGTAVSISTACAGRAVWPPLLADWATAATASSHRDVGGCTFRGNLLGTSAAARCSSQECNAEQCRRRILDKQTSHPYEAQAKAPQHRKAPQRRKLPAAATAAAPRRGDARKY